MASKANGEDEADPDVGADFLEDDEDLKVVEDAPEDFEVEGSSDDDDGPRDSENSWVRTAKGGDAICTVAVHPGNPSLIATGSQDERARVYCLPSASPPHDFLNVDHAGSGRPTVELHPVVVNDADFKDTVASVSYSHDGRYLAAVGLDGNILVLDAADDADPAYKVAQRLEGPSADAEWARWHPRGYALLAGFVDGSVWMWWAPTGAVLRVFAGHGTAVTCGDFGGNGRKVCTGDADGVAIIFDPKSGESLHRFDHHFHTAPITCLETFSAEDETQQFVATGSDDCTVRLVHAESGKRLAQLTKHSAPVNVLAFHEIEQRPLILASGCMNGEINVWDALSEKNRSSLRGIQPNEAVTGLRWHPTEVPLLFASTNNGVVRMWDVRMSTPVAELTSGRSRPILDLKVADLPGAGAGSWSTRVVTGGDDGVCRVWNVMGEKR